MVFRFVLPTKLLFGAGSLKQLGKECSKLGKKAMVVTGSTSMRKTGVLDRVVEDLKAKEGVLDVLIHHRSGYIETGNDIVYIVVLGAHRSQVFSALSDAIERVKKEVPIWKKELTIDGDYWIHDKA